MTPAIRAYSPQKATAEMHISRVTQNDLPDLLPLMRDYCAFYGVEPPAEKLWDLCRTLLADPDCEGFQLIARADDGRAVAFATIYWSWSTLTASRTAILNDVYVSPDVRGYGLAEALIEEARQRCTRRATALTWQTAKDNLRAQRVYERIHAAREEWLLYSLPTGPLSLPR
jgi:GNAT superfamily N-acetyltransferase